MENLSLTIIAIGSGLIILVLIVIGFLIVRSNNQKRSVNPPGLEKPIPLGSSQEIPIPAEGEYKNTRVHIPSLDYCPSCGTSVNPGSTFCSDCGYEFEE